MALQIWLPLNGNLENKGIMDISFSSYLSGTGLAINSNGKLGGSCYERTSVQANSYRSNKTVNFSGDVTICCWAYMTGGSNDVVQGIVSNHNHGNNGSGFGINFMKISDSDYRISCSAGRTSSDRVYNHWYGTTNIKNAWHHLAFTYNRQQGQVKLYVDGKCEKIVNDYFASTGSNTIDLFAWSTGYVDKAEYRALGRINDVRFYDHCLSGKEISLVAQGLVAHYPFDNNGQGGVNLLTNGNASTTNNSYGMVTLTPNPIMVAGETYTLTLCVTPAANVAHYCPYVSSGYSNLATFTVNGTDKQIITQSFTCKYSSGREPSVSAAHANIVFYRFPNDGSVTTNSTFHWAKLEKGTGETIAYWSPHFSATDFDKTIYDCSGYGHHGTATGNIYTEKNSPRYDEATIFDGSTVWIDLPLKTVMGNLLKDKCTINFWCKEGNTSSRSVYFGGYPNSNFNIEMNGGKFRVYWNAKPDWQISSVENNIWTMWTVAVDKATGFTVYKNGELIETYTKTSDTMPDLAINSNFRIGWDYRGGADLATVMEGSMSDFRIYATQLSATDIKELYNTPISIGKTGAAMAYMFKEV